MALAAGVTFLLIVDLGRRLLKGTPIYATGWVAAFTALRAIMAFLGAVMTVTWPLKEVAPNCCEQDNIVLPKADRGRGGRVSSLPSFPP
jgi:hypothetical protein